MSFSYEFLDDVALADLAFDARGFGHQVATEYLKVFQKAMRRYGLTVKDPQLACAAFHSHEAQDCFAAMKCAANTASPTAR